MGFFKHFLVAVSALLLISCVQMSSAARSLSHVLDYEPIPSTDPGSVPPIPGSGRIAVSLDRGSVLPTTGKERVIDGVRRVPMQEDNDANSKVSSAGGATATSVQEDLHAHVDYEFPMPNIDPGSVPPIGSTATSVEEDLHAAHLDYQLPIPNVDHGSVPPIGS